MVNDNMNIDRDIIVISSEDDSFTEITTASDNKVIGLKTDCDCKDMSIDLTNETIFSLNVLESSFERNSDLDKYIAELEDVLNTDIKEITREIVTGGNETIKNEFKNEADNRDKNDLHLTLSNNKNSFDSYSKSIYDNRQNLNLTFLKDNNNDIGFKKCVENHSELNDKNGVTTRSDIQNNFDVKAEQIGDNKHLDVRSPCSVLNKSFDLSLSQCSSKRSRSDSENSDIMPKKFKGSPIKRVSIVPKNCETKITIDLAKEVQRLISIAIDKASFLPLLQCHGIKNNNLVYSCHCEKSYLWLKKIIDVAKYLKVKIVDVEFKDEKYFKLKLKINSYFEESLDKLLNRIELYNAGLVTDKWKLINRQYFRNFIVMTLWVDRDSFDYISDCNFSLFAGVDKIQLSICF